MVARMRTPQPKACRIPARSAGLVISSTASHSGFIPRSSICMPAAFGQPESTSVCGPRSNCGTPCTAPASSSRSSTTPTRLPAAESARMQLRSSVVLPLPGRPASRQEADKSGRSCSGGCRISCGMRMQSDEISRIPVTRPSCTTALPHTPIRTPPGTLRNPSRSCSCTAYCDWAEAASSVRCSSCCGVRSQCGSGCSTPRRRMEGTCPHRSRISSTCAAFSPSSACAASRGRICSTCFSNLSAPFQSKSIAIHAAIFLHLDKAALPL